MALITASPEENLGPPSNAAWQRYLAFLDSTVVGEPGRPRAIPEPFEPVGETELVDGPVVAPESPKPPRKRSKHRPVPEDFPTGDRDLKLLARKLTGRD